MKLTRFWGVGLAILWTGTSACTSTTSERTVTGPITEQRTRLDPNVPVITSDWSLEGRTVTGQLHLSACVSVRKWITSDERVVHREPLTGWGWGFVGVGTVTELVGILTRDSSAPPPPCMSGYVTADGSQCGGPGPDNTGSLAAVVVGAAMVAGGLLMIAESPSDHVTTLKSEQHTETTHGTCILPRDLSTLSLLLRVADNRYVHLDVSENGAAHADLPPAVHLRPGADLPVIVYRGPAALADAIPRMQVVGSLHVPE